MKATTNKGEEFPSETKIETFDTVCIILRKRKKP